MRAVQLTSLELNNPDAEFKQGALHPIPYPMLPHFPDCPAGYVHACRRLQKDYNSQCSLGQTQHLQRLVVAGGL